VDQDNMERTWGLEDTKPKELPVVVVLAQVVLA
jgi:hypothetical protein